MRHAKGVIGDAAGSSLRAQEARSRRQTGMGVPVPDRGSGFETVAAARLLPESDAAGSTRTCARTSPSTEGRRRQHADAEGARRGVPRPIRRGTGYRASNEGYLSDGTSGPTSARRPRRSGTTRARASISRPAASTRALRDEPVLIRIPQICQPPDARRRADEARTGPVLTIRTTSPCPKRVRRHLSDAVSGNQTRDLQGLS